MVMREGLLLEALDNMLTERTKRSQQTAPGVDYRQYSYDFTSQSRSLPSRHLQHSAPVKRGTQSTGREMSEQQQTDSHKEASLHLERQGIGSPDDSGHSTFEVKDAGVRDGIWEQLQKDKLKA